MVKQKRKNVVASSSVETEYRTRIQTNNEVD